MDLITLAMAKAYTDSQRIGYTEGGELASAQLAPNTDLGANVCFVEGAIGLEAGKTYTVKLDSGTYSAKCEPFENTALFIGNTGLLGVEGLPNTGEPFLVGTIDDVGDGTTWITLFLATDGSTSCTVSDEIVHPIDPKYLPEGGFGYTTPDKVKVLVTATCVAGEEVIRTNVPLVLEKDRAYRVRLNGKEYECVASNLLNTEVLYIGSVAVSDPTFADKDLPFLYQEAFMNGVATSAIKTTESGDFSIEITETSVIHTIDPKYLPDTVATKADILGAMEASY